MYKKELSIGDNPLSENSKNLNLSFGIPKGFDIRSFKKNMNKVNLEDLIYLKRIIIRK